MSIGRKEFGFQLAQLYHVEPIEVPTRGKVAEYALDDFEIRRRFEANAEKVDDGYRFYMPSRINLFRKIA